MFDNRSTGYVVAAVIVLAIGVAIVCDHRMYDNPLAGATPIAASPMLRLVSVTAPRRP